MVLVFFGEGEEALVRKERHRLEPAIDWGPLEIGWRGEGERG